MIKNYFTKGSTLMEVVVVSAILSVVALAFLGTFATISRFHEKNMRIIKAELISEEGIEALRLIKSAGFNTLSSLARTQKHYFALATSSWSVTSTPEIIDGMFYRSFTINSVSRDVSDDIVSSGGTVDPDILLIKVDVDWDWRHSTNTASYQSYITNI